MEHPVEHMLLAYLDDELSFRDSDAIGKHLAGCPPCQARARELAVAAGDLAAALSCLDVPAPVLTASELQERLVADALHELDRPAPDLSVEDLHRAVRADSEKAPSDAVSIRRWGRPRRRPLLAAALVVIFVAGASAAIPGSPVREWLAHSVARVLGGTGETVVDTPALNGEARVPSPAAISVQPRDGLVRIMITRAAPETVIRVRLLDRGSASVWSVQGRYRTAPGEIELLEAGPGEVLVLLPRSIPSAEVRLDGQVVATKEGPDFRLLIPAADSSDAEVSFRAGG